VEKNRNSQLGCGRFHVRRAGLEREPILPFPDGKTVFHLIGLNERGHIVVKKRLSRKQLITLTVSLPVCLIGMEACAGSHLLGRMLRAQGHDVKLMPAEYVRPFLKSDKDDSVDAEAIAEAVQRPTMRFVPIKNEAQVVLQALHRVRDRWMGRRTAVINPDTPGCEW
jgi:transposase